MNNTNSFESLGKFSYQIDFQYKKFDKDLKAMDFIKSQLTIIVEEPVPEPLQRQWTAIISEIHPTYFHIEIIEVKLIE